MTMDKRPPSVGAFFAPRRGDIGEHGQVNAHLTAWNRATEAQNEGILTEAGEVEQTTHTTHKMLLYYLTQAARL